MVDPVISLGAGLLLALVLATAAWHKLRAPAHFAATLEAYRLLPARLAPVVARVLPFVELAAAIALLWPATRPAGGAGAALLFTLYAIAMGINLARGRTAIDCGCGDPDQRQPLSGWLLLRNAALVAAAGACALPVTMRTTGWLDAAVALLAATMAGLLYAAGNQLLANREQLANLGGSHGHA